MHNFIFCEKNNLLIGKSTDPVINEYLDYGFSTRDGGISEGDLSSLNLGIFRPDKKENITFNLRLFCNEINVNYKHTVFIKQIHSDNIVSVKRQDAGTPFFNEKFLPDCDGIITSSEKLPVGVFFADCTPVLLFDSEKKCLSVLHCGWRGTVKGFAQKGVLNMVNSFGCNPENIHVVIGPCIGACHFEVSQNVCDEFISAGLSSCVINGNTKDKFFVDLKKANYIFLKKAGIIDDNITISKDCTCCNTEMFFSHRACGENTGRLALIAQIK